MQWFDNLMLKWKLVLGFGVPLVLMLSIAALVNGNLNRLLTSSGLVNHTYEAIGMGEGITASLVNMETGFRGFLVVGDENFLEPYHQGKQDFAQLIAQTKEKVSDNATQVGRLEEVATLATQWQTQHVDVGLAYRREVNQGEQAALHFKEVSSRTVGKEKFDGFRAALAQVDAAFTQSNDITAQSLSKLILMDMINQETGQRGFLLSGQEASLEPYIAGISDFESHTNELKQHVNQAYDRNIALDNIKNVQRIINTWETEVAQVGIELKRRANTGQIFNDQVIEFVLSGLGKKYFDETRGYVQALEDAFTRSNDVLALGLLTTMAKNMVDMETGFRGFLLTGQDPSLEPYKQWANWV